MPISATRVLPGGGLEIAAIQETRQGCFVIRVFRRVVSQQMCLLALAGFFLGCSPGSGVWVDPGSSGASGDTFGYRKWLARNVDPDVVVIGIHGFCGASIDYRNLGRDLLRYQPKTALYAYEVRGQGSDPVYARRGDIGKPADWYADLFAFTEMVRDLHPRAKIIWFGESMGALIATHAYCESPADSAPCDAIVLSSPIVRFRDDIPAWTPGLVQVAAGTLPLARISLEALSAGQEVQVTQGSVHNEQVKKNDYHVDQHTLRLIGALTGLIDGMNRCAASFRVPVLVLHGGHDYFNNDADVRGFVARIPAGVPVTYRNYPEAYHLLMYDEEKESVFRDFRGWVRDLRHRGFR